MNGGSALSIDPVGMQAVSLQLTNHHAPPIY